MNTQPKAVDLDELQTGDLIFIAVPTLLFRQVAAATNSWTSHVGLVIREPDGDVYVYESAIPRSRRVSVSSFIRRSDRGRFEVRRPIDPLSPEEQLALGDEAKARMGIWYDLGFDYDGRGQYCSKFVYECYLAATGREIGRLQSFRELLDENPGVGLGFWRCWFAGFIPWERRTVSPASQLNSAETRTVHLQNILYSILALPQRIPQPMLR
ncbi:MAG: YiiX/YebB-like N1pC/P60 family cysteine hydrolase [Verrucomicrobiota bacterium]